MQERGQTQREIMRDAGYITAAEAAEALGVGNVGTIHRMVKSGRVKGARAGVHWYVSVNSLLLAHAGTPPLIKRIEALGVAPKDEPLAEAPKKRKAVARGRRAS